MNATNDIVQLIDLDKYYHVFIKWKDEEDLVKTGLTMGYTIRELKKCITEPFNEGLLFVFNGEEISRDCIKQIQIFSSTVSRPEDVLLPDGKPMDTEAFTETTLQLFQSGKVPTILGVVNSSFLYPKRKDKKSKVDAKDAEKNKIFIVHGRDKGPALELKDYLKDTYSLDVVIFDDVKKKRTSLTIIELLEDIASNAGYAFIVATPDDLGAYCKDIIKCKDEILTSETINIKSIQTILSKLKFRARQNVVFEHGLFLGALGRDRVCCLLQADTEEKQTDIDGIIYVRFKENISETFPEIVEKLKAPKISLIK